MQTNTVSTKFKEGDIVICDYNNPGDGKPFKTKVLKALHPGSDSHVAVEHPKGLRIEQDSAFGNHPGHRSRKWDTFMWVEDYNLKMASDGIERDGKIDTDQLKALIMDDATKNEIISTLKQHENHTKLFEDWGLGETIEYGKGMTFMFHGSPGTGKTWGAKCIAKALKAELHTIGAAEIQSQEPGGANRAIMEAFETAKTEGKVLFIDECDSLITSRADVGMILASEINTLLTEIEKFEGVCILATNRIDTMDEALERRISLIVEFPEPMHGQRIEIFRNIMPQKMPVEADVTCDVLADHKLTGGQIKNVVLQAARLAMGEGATAVGMRHFDAAVSRLQKSKGRMGSESRYRQGVANEAYTKSVGTRKVKDRKLSADMDIE